ncbi:MAG: TonB-dependent receptor [Sulfurovum sp.]|nr:TonB-dependent receptor [Sulfurovum sp.]
MIKKQAIALSFICAASLLADEVQMQTIDVNASIDTEVIKDIHGEDVKSADLAEALFKQSPSVSLVRRSGIANDIIVRGQKKDNISVTIDGVKIYGACPNRMDPPVSHVLTNNIDYIEINEGPYNVEDFGVLSADVKVHTIKPEQAFHGDVNLGFGSWGYQKAAATLTGGTDTVRFLLSGSAETSEQYKDGDGNDFVGQIQREIDAGKVSSVWQYQDRYKDMDAYDKKTLMAKLFWDITDNQELRLSYTANRSDDILYPSSKMDALYDDSDIYNAEYTLKDLGKYSKELYLQLYRSQVEHPMSTKYREIAALDSDPNTPGVQTSYMTHTLTTQVDGAKIKNTFNIGNHEIAAGVDYSLRNWDGWYTKNDKPLPEKYYHSIWDVDTENIGFFVTDKIAMDRLVLDFGLRYDDTSVTSSNPAQQANDYDELNGYINGTYHLDEHSKLFAGFGKSSRVPDGKELYWVGSPMTMPDGTVMAPTIGTPDLKNTLNYEFDLAYETQFDSGMFKIKAFYSMLDNFIAYNADKMQNRYENVDATIYGFELSGTYVALESLSFDYGLAYQRGKKDRPLTGQTGTNMPEIPPLKFNGAVNYDWDETFTLRAELVASDSWTNYDAENGEQELDGYAVVNLKAVKTFAKNFEITVGVDNLFDTTYAVSNTYKDLILLPTTSGNDAIMLMNEPGRYVYTNLRYKF